MAWLAWFASPVPSAAAPPGQAVESRGHDHGTRDSDDSVHEHAGAPEASAATEEGGEHEHAHPSSQESSPQSSEAGSHESSEDSAPESIRTPTPRLTAVTDADRAAAFPDVEGHAVHDRAVHFLVLFDQLEWQSGDGGRTGAWEQRGWIGRDLNRLWFRTEGSGTDGALESAEAHVMYGRLVAAWWDLVVGVRHEFRPGPARTWAAIGIQGLAPYWFEIEATAYVGEAGRTQLRLESEYELLLTNRLVLQPLVELDFYGKSDPERGIGSGLSDIDTGLRLRYEIRRELAPYVGVVWTRSFFGTADRARRMGDDPQDVRLAIGARVWF
jgi:copper resistance protein B